MIRKADELIGILLEKLNLAEVTIAVTGDHTTTCQDGEHTGEPVPCDILTRRSERRCHRIR